MKHCSDDLVVVLFQYLDHVNRFLVCEGFLFLKKQQKNNCSTRYSLYHLLKNNETEDIYIINHFYIGNEYKKLIKIKVTYVSYFTKLFFKRLHFTLMFPACQYITFYGLSFEKIFF